MPKQKSYDQSKKVFEEFVVKVYQTIEGKMGETQLRVVSWIVDGKKNQAALEKRAFVIREYQGQPQKQMGKAKGFNVSDIFFLTNDIGWEVITKDLQDYNDSIKNEIPPNTRGTDKWDMDNEEKVAEEMFS